MVPLLDGTPEGVRALAQDALNRLQLAKAARGSISRTATPALLAGWQAASVLKQAIAHPEDVAMGALGQSGARQKLGLMLRAATGRW